MTVIDELQAKHDRIKALEAELARKQTAPAPTVKTLAQLEYEYRQIPSDTAEGARERAAFRAKYRKELAL